MKVIEVGDDAYALELRLNLLTRDGYTIQASIDGHPGQYMSDGTLIEGTWSPALLVLSRPADPVAAVLTAIALLTTEQVAALVDRLPDRVTDPILECADRAARLYGAAVSTRSRSHLVRNGRAGHA